MFSSLKTQNKAKESTTGVHFAIKPKKDETMKFVFIEY